MRKVKPQCPETGSEDKGTNRNLTYLESSGGLLLNATSIITGMFLDQQIIYI